MRFVESGGDKERFVAMGFERRYDLVCCLIVAVLRVRAVVDLNRGPPVAEALLVVVAGRWRRGRA